MTIASIARRRNSCRNYTDEILPKEKITSLINDAVWVPSGSNNQPWLFVVITDKEKLRSYSDAAKNSWLAALDDYPHMKQYEQTFRSQHSNIFYNAPCLIIIYGNSESYWHVYDCSMIAGNMHLLAEEEGLGCCWIGEAHNVFAEPSVKEELGVPEKYRLVAPLILGHPTHKRTCPHSPNARRPFEILFR